PGATSKPELIRLMVGRTLSEVYPQSRRPPDGPLLEVDHLGRPGAFESVTFSVARGEILGVFGLVGSGRSAMARAIFGAEPAETGTIRIEGQSLRPASPRQAVAQGIALLTEDRKRDGLVMHLSVRDNVSLSSFGRLSRSIVIDRARQDSAVLAKTRQLDIRPPDPGRLVRYLSGGNQQKVVLAKWLMTEARVLILDEPTRGVDVATKVEFYQLIGDLADQGLAIILISSELPEVLGMSDRILVMRDGRIVGESTRAEATEEAILSRAAGVG
ncbi:MAG TPA: ATP-binding cassette domain-containing protein, partial [Anaerolineales bacterium]|nr:ATP-binding cassette domain-containing protein [Anaerolineales bacterium]